MSMFFAFSQLHPNGGAQLRSEILLLPPPLCNSYEGELVATGRANSANPSNPLVESHVQEEEFVEENSLAHPGVQLSTVDAALRAMDGSATPDPRESASDLS
jgi:hypothetical protein